MKRWAQRARPWLERAGRAPATVVPQARADQKHARRASLAASVPDGNPKPKKRARTSRRRQPAASLPHLPAVAQEALSHASDGMRSQRQLGNPAASAQDAETKLAVRLQSGRTLVNLQRLLARGLSAVNPIDVDSKSLLPSSGITATLRSQQVLILNR